MTTFDTLIEEYSKKGRTTTRRERYPSNIDLSYGFLEVLEKEYDENYVEGNRNIHSNFLKAISFEIDKIRDKMKEEGGDMDVEIVDIVDDVIDQVDDGECPAMSAGLEPEVTVVSGLPTL